MVQGSVCLAKVMHVFTDNVAAQVDTKKTGGHCSAAKKAGVSLKLQIVVPLYTNTADVTKGTQLCV